ncbi:MFS transporter [Ideonella sp. DXS29W]|uniref:MFS transporter n=1 Tax=Ideonella lacteola TaxID=2984193 RepID=A0ABU9BVN7_9BURK
MSAVGRATWAVRAQFFVLGAMFATWGVHVPTVKAQYGLGEQALALAMLASGAGALLALAQAGRIVGRWGPRCVAGVMGVACCVSVGALLAWPAYAALLVVMLAFGISGSLLDVSINTEATEVEQRTGKHLMSGFHGMFSLGGMAGASLGGAASGLGLTPQSHLLAVTVAGVVSTVVASRAMLPVPDDHVHTQQPLSLPRGPLLLMGVLAAMGLIAEGAMYDWSVLFMRQERASPSGLAAMAYASFSGAMAAGRFTGDWVRSRLGGALLLTASGILAALGMTLALMLPTPAAAFAGFALVGLGLSNVAPVLFSAATRVPGVSSAHGIAAVSGVGYLGMMAGPPLIGVIAEHASLSAGLWVVVAFAAFMAISAKRAMPPG